MSIIVIIIRSRRDGFVCLIVGINVHRDHHAPCGLLETGLSVCARVWLNTLVFEWTCVSVLQCFSPVSLPPLPSPVVGVLLFWLQCFGLLRREGAFL